MAKKIKRGVPVQFLDRGKMVTGEVTGGPFLVAPAIPAKKIRNSWWRMYMWRRSNKDVIMCVVLFDKPIVNSFGETVPADLIAVHKLVVRPQ